MAVALFILASVVIFAAALAGGLMDETAFTPAAQDPAPTGQAGHR